MAAYTLDLGEQTYRSDIVDTLVRDNSPISANIEPPRSKAAFWIGDEGTLRAHDGRVVRGVSISGRLYRARSERVAIELETLRAFGTALAVPPLQDFGYVPGVPSESGWDINYTVPTTTKPILPIYPWNYERGDFWAGLSFRLLGRRLDIGTGTDADLLKLALWRGSIKLHMSKPASAEFTASPQVGVGNVAQYPIEVTCKYPDGDPVTGVELRCYTTSDKVRFRRAGTNDPWKAEAFGTLNSQGKVAFDFRGEKEGTASVNVWATDEPQRFCFEPAMARYFPIEVFGAQPDDPPDEPDDDLGAIGAPTPQPPPGATNEPPAPSVDPVTNCITYPAVTGIKTVPAYVEYVSVFAWDSGANSVDTVEGDAECVFTMKKVVGAVLGFTTDRDVSGSKERIEHGFYFFQNAAGQPLFRVMENGKAVSSEQPYVPDGTQFRLQRAGDLVTYIVDNEVIMRSRKPSVGELSVGTSLYAPGDEVP